jgi:VWFA-related protein
VDGTGVFELKNNLLAGSLALLMIGGQAQAGQQTTAQQAIPDAPRPQTNLPVGNVAPGQGSASSSANDGGGTQGAGASPAAAAAQVAPQPPANGTAAPNEKAPTYEPPPGEGNKAVQTIRAYVNEVEIPFTVKDSKNQLVSGLKARDVQVYENGLLQKILVFHNDPLPMAVALVIDQSMTQDQMDKVNTALGALQDAFTKYDEVSVFTYNKSPKKVTDFTGAASPRLTQAIERSKGDGREVLMAGSLSGPMAQTTNINNQDFDYNTAPVHGHTGIELNVPKEVHPLNDAILAAATGLSTQPVDYRRVIYVISNGNEYGSKAKTSEVIKYLQTNGIEVDGTLVGDTAIWGMGFLDKFHLPLQMQDNVLIKYKNATGGNLDSEFRTQSIEKSFARVASEARSRYTLAYVTHEPFIDGKYRKVEVKVLLPNLTVLARPGYWPAAMEMRPRTAAPAQ